MNPETMSLLSWLGVAGAAITVAAGLIRIFEFWDGRPRLRAEVYAGQTECGDGGELASVFEIQVTNVGAKPLTITSVTAGPFRGRLWFLPKIGPEEYRISDESGLGNVKLGPNESTTFGFFHHDLHWWMSSDWASLEDGPKKERQKKAATPTGMLCRIYHTKARRPKLVRLN